MRRNFQDARLTARYETQRALADQLGVSTDTVNKIELGHRNPSIQLALRLQEVLKQPIAHLLERDVTNKTA